MQRQLITNLVLVGHRVCAIDEITDACVAEADAIVSIDDPGQPVPQEITRAEKPLLRLSFFDYDHEDEESPHIEHVQALIAFAADTKPAQKLLVHCYAGISRSTASLAVIFAVMHPTLAYDDIFEAIYQIRPQAWPNTRLIAYADQVLKCNGQFSAALARFRRSVTSNVE